MSTYPVTLHPRCFEQAQLQTWAKGNIVYEALNVNDRVYYVCSGQVLLTRLLIKGTRKTLYVVDKGYFFFEARYFYPQPRALQALAGQASVTALFKRQAIENLIQQEPSFRLALYQSLSTKALSAASEMIDIACGTSERRMLGILTALAASDQSETQGMTADMRDPPNTIVRITQTALAERMGLHPVSVNRILKKLEKADYIETGRNFIIMHSKRLRGLQDL